MREWDSKRLLPLTTLLGLSGRRLLKLLTQLIKWLIGRKITGLPGTIGRLGTRAKGVPGPRSMEGRLRLRSTGSRGHRKSLRCLDTFIQVLESHINCRLEETGAVERQVLNKPPSIIRQIGGPQPGVSPNCHSYCKCLSCSLQCMLSIRDLLLSGCKAIGRQLEQAIPLFSRQRREIGDHILKNGIDVMGHTSHIVAGLYSERTH